MATDRDEALRWAAFDYLARLVARSGGPVRRPELEAFTFEGTRIRLLAPQQGIWTPRGLPAALSILTTYAPRPDLRPYQDDPGLDGYPRYKWRGTDPYHHDNVSLRRAMELGRPLIWFVGVAPGIYEANFPVWLVGEEPQQHQFVVALDETMRNGWHEGLVSLSSFDPTRRYAERIVLQRLHQRPFRDRVLLAYEERCALCRLRHRLLLDAAHIQGGLGWRRADHPERHRDVRDPPPSLRRARPERASGLCGGNPAGRADRARRSDAPARLAGSARRGH